MMITARTTFDVRMPARTVKYGVVVVVSPVPRMEL